MAGGVPAVGQSGCDPGCRPPRCDRTRLTQRLPAGRPSESPSGRGRGVVGVGDGCRLSRKRCAPQLRPSRQLFRQMAKTNRERNTHRSQGGRNANTERSFIYTVLCTNVTPNNFFLFFKMHLWKIWSVFFFFHESRRVGSSAGRRERERITWEQVDSSRHSCKNRTTTSTFSSSAGGSLLFCFVFFPSVC